MANMKLELNFKRADGYNAKMSIADAREDVTGEDAAAFMDLVIGTEIFQPSGSPMAEKVSAQLISTEITNLSV